MNGTYRLVPILLGRKWQQKGDALISELQRGRRQMQPNARRRRTTREHHHVGPEQWTECKRRVDREKREPLPPTVPAQEADRLRNGAQREDRDERRKPAESPRPSSGARQDQREYQAVHNRGDKQRRGCGDGHRCKLQHAHEGTFLDILAMLKRTDRARSERIRSAERDGPIR